MASDKPMENDKVRAEVEAEFAANDGKTVSRGVVMHGAPSEGFASAAQAVVAKLQAGKVAVAYVGYIGLPQSGESTSDCGLEIISENLDPLTLLLLADGNVQGQVADQVYAALTSAFEQQVKNAVLNQQLATADLDKEKGN